MTPKQQLILNILNNNKDNNDCCSISIHQLGYPLTPDSINPALADLEILKANKLISSYERTSSRGVKVCGIVL